MQIQEWKSYLMLVYILSLSLSKKCTCLCTLGGIKHKFYTKIVYYNIKLQKIHFTQK